MFPHRSLGGLRCFVPDGTGQRVAQPLNEFSDGVDFNLFWLILRAPTGLGDISRMFSHRSRGGLRCFVPDGTGQRVAQPLNEFSDGVDFKFVLVSFARPYLAWGSTRTGLMVTRAATEKIWFTGNDFGCIRCNLGGQN